MNMLLILMLGACLSRVSPSAEPPARVATEIACCAAGQPAASAPADPPSGEAGDGTTEGARVSVRLEIPGSWRFRKPDLTRAVVYLESHPNLDGAPRQSDLATIAQKRKKFVPDFVVVSKGATVEFPNWDDFDHNVFSRSEAAPAFDLDRYPRGQSKSRVFEKTGVVQVFCNIHPQMRATVVVAPNPFFAVADETGAAALENVPPGAYELVVWHAHCEEHRERIEVTAEDCEFGATLHEERGKILGDRKREGGYGVEAGLGIERERLDLPVVEESHPAKSKEPG
jgi:plastocyanin